MQGQVFYPPWLLAFMPAVILFTLLAGFLLNTIVIVICMFCMKLPNKGKVYRKLIVRTWLVSFALDGIAPILFLIITFAGRPFSVVEDAVLNPTNSVGGFLIAFAIVAAVGVVKFFVYVKILWKREAMLTGDQKKKMAMALGIATAPWAFMIPTATVYTLTFPFLGSMYTSS